MSHVIATAKCPVFWLNTGHFSNFLVFLGIVRFAIWDHFGGYFGQKLVCLGYAVRIPNRYLIGNIPNMNKKSEPIPHREEVRIFHIVGVCFLGFGIFKQKMYLILSLFC